jgi:uncharacterized protein (DUF2252 family)
MSDDALSARAITAAGQSDPLVRPSTRAGAHVGERAARGRAARAQVPRRAHAQIEFHEPRDVVARLEEQAVSRVPELVPIRYGRMLVSPFAFYRGGAAIMAADLSHTTSTGLRVQLCGDAHLSNFGVFASPERNLVFDINDFDETAPGPWEWDVKRLAASLAIAGRDNGFAEAKRRAVVEATVGSYREAMTTFAGMRNLDLWYLQLDTDRALREYRQGLDPKRVKRAEAQLARARTMDSMHALTRLARVVDGEAQIVSDPPLLVPVSELIAADADRDRLETEMLELVRMYQVTLQTDRRRLLEQFRLVDIARKVVGVGSVGTSCWVVLCVGVDDSDPLFLQIKEAQASILEPFAGETAFAHHGERVVAGQRLMQATSDIFLGWTRAPLGLSGQPRDFYVRQLKDWKGSAVIEGMTPRGMSVYGRLCGWTLARAHARSGDRIALAAYMGNTDIFDRALSSFAEAYADQNERDYATLQHAVASGRIKAEVGL